MGCIVGCCRARVGGPRRAIDGVLRELLGAFDAKPAAKPLTERGRQNGPMLASPRFAEVSMAKYGKAAGKRVESAMRRKKKGTLKSSSGRKVKSRKQAIAIALSEARSKGAKVPAKKKKAAKKK
jgi:hypothetical protein